MNVLIINKNILQTKILSRVILQISTSLFTADTISNALQIISEYDIDAVILDLYKENTKAIKQIRNSNKSIKIILLSDEPNKDADIVLPKPLQLEAVKAFLGSFEEEEDVFDVLEFEAFYDTKELQKEILETFIEEKNEDYSKIQDAFKSKDIHAIYSIVHYLKGSFGYLKATKIFNLSKLICDLCKSNNKDEVVKLENKYISYYNEFYQAVKDYLKS